jgi:hypothetical protein
VPLPETKLSPEIAKFFDEYPIATYTKRGIEIEPCADCGFCGKHVPVRTMRQAWDWLACNACFREMDGP